MTSADTLVARGLLREDVPLGAMTTYKAGGPARYFAEVVDRDALRALAETGVIGSLPVLVLGRGSNLVVADSGFPGLVIKLGAGFGGIDFGDGSVTAGAAVHLPRLARATVEHGLTGLEFFVGVPGTVGGGVRQNAGCFGEETADHLITASVMDLIGGEVTDRSADILELSYRHSNLETTEVVVDANFKVTPGYEEASREQLRRITRWRRDHQPGGTLNAGSVFKNPPGSAAGEIIDRLGLKGMSVGDVSVSEKHANFFVAGPEATAQDIRALVAAVKDRVFAETGTNLEPEIQFVGFPE